MKDARPLPKSARLNLQANKMANPITMPKLGLTMTEAVLANWQVSPGQVVKSGDILFVIETDKIASEIEATDDGVVGELSATEGHTYDVGAVLGFWAEGGGASTAEVPAQDAIQAPLSAAAPAVTAQNKAPRAEGERLLSTPLARRVAGQNGIDIVNIAGSGPNGRIKLCDVEQVMSQKSAPQAPQNVVQPQVAEGQPAEAKAQTRRPTTAFEKVVARRMVEAKTTIPHFYVMTEVDITALSELRKTLNADGSGGKVSINHLIVKAVGAALVQMPEVNRLWAEGDIIQLSEPDIGIAVDTPKGLYAPVLRNAGKLSLNDLVAKSGDLITAAREGVLSADALKGGAISVSNVGMFSASHLIPIVNPGQSSILGVGASKPVFRPDADGQPSLREELNLALSADHRVMNGVTAAKFLNLIKQMLEAPLRLLRY